MTSFYSIYLLPLAVFCLSPSLSASQDISNSTLILDASKAEQCFISDEASSREWVSCSLGEFRLGKVCDAGANQVRIKFKGEKTAKWKDPDNIPMVCSYKKLSSYAFRVDIRDVDEEDDGTISMTFYVLFHSEDKGSAVGEVWFRGKNFIIRGLEVQLRKQR